MPLVLQIVPPSPEGQTPSLLERVGIARIVFRTHNDEEIGAFAHMRAVDAFLECAVAGKIGDRVVLSEDERVILKAEVDALNLPTDVVTLYDKIVALAPTDVADTGGLTVQRCTCPESFQRHAHIFKDGEFLKSFGTLDGAIVDIDRAIVQGSVPSVEAATTLLRQVRATDVPTDAVHRQQLYDAATEEERQAFRERIEREKAEEEERQRQFQKQIAEAFGIPEDQVAIIDVSKI